MTIYLKPVTVVFLLDKGVDMVRFKGVVVDLSCTEVTRVCHEVENS